MSDYLLKHGTRATAQNEPIRADQVENSAGGYVWEVDEWTRLRRWLILGSEGGSYYASERDLTTANVSCVRECIRADGPRAVAEIVAVSDSGRAPKNDPALYALAAAISLGDRETKQAAAEALPSVARIGTHLYHFVAYAETMRGWGRTMRWAVSNWYAQNPDQLALQAIKYRQRDGWSHRDLLRLAHPRNVENAVLFDWICHGSTSRAAPAGSTSDIPAGTLIQGFERAQRSKSAKETAELATLYRLPREALLTEHLSDPVVWQALLQAGMPLTAMTRNLATMTRVGALNSTEHRALVLSALDNRDGIKRSRLHPLALLVALRTYASGHGWRGGNTWNPMAPIIDALDAAFYLAFENVEPTGKNHLLALDVSGSMGQGQVAGSPLTPREAAVAMALVTLHAEEEVEVMAFARNFMTLPLSRRQRLDDAVAMTTRLGFDGTDCSLPFLYAMQRGKAARTEAFVVYTDSETWAGQIHPKQALDQYRALTGIQARSVVVGMVSNGFTIADPQDPGMMDVVGFDTAAPGLIGEFVAGRV